MEHIFDSLGVCIRCKLSKGQIFGLNNLQRLGDKVTYSCSGNSVEGLKNYSKLVQDSYIIGGGNYIPAKKETLGEKIIFTKDFAGYKEGHIFFINKSGYYNESRGIMKNIQKDMMELLFKEGIVKNYVEEKTTLTKQEIAEKLGIKVEDLIIK